MTPQEVKERLLAELQNNAHGATTRRLCNLLFMQSHEHYIVIPGDYRMKEVYGHLKTLVKSGKVINDYPGHWKLNVSTKQ